nr:hypothetical protein [Bacteroidota bacterium]
DIYKVLEDKYLLMSLHPSSAHDFSVLFLMQSEGDFENRNFKRFIDKVIPGNSIIEHTFKEQKIREIVNKVKERIITYAFLDGVLVLSRNSVLVEDAVTAFEKNKSGSNAMLEYMLEAKDAEKLFVNYASVPQFLNVWLDATFQPRVEKLSTMQAFGAYSWAAENEKLVFNGVVKPVNSSSLWEAFLKQKPVLLSAIKAAPVQTAFYTNGGVSDFYTFRKHQVETAFLKAEKDSFNSKKFVLEQHKGINFDSAMRMVPREWLHGILEPVNDKVPIEEYLIVGPIVNGSFKNALNNWKNNIESVSPNLTVIPEYRGYPLEQTNFGPLLELFYGGHLASFTMPRHT